MRPTRSSIDRSTGAALPVALMLFLVVTLLAVAGMRTSSLGLIMAGNEQNRQKAFLASESGIEQALTFGTYNPAVLALGFMGTVPNTANDAYNAIIRRQLGGQPQGPLWGGQSASHFSTYHFEIQSTGTSVRNAQTLHNQGMFVVAPYSAVFNGAGGL